MTCNLAFMNELDKRRRVLASALLRGASAEGRGKIVREENTYSGNCG